MDSSVACVIGARNDRSHAQPPWSARLKEARLAKIVYRYDNDDYPDGCTVRSRGDSFAALNPIEKKVEQRIRDLMPDGQSVRGKSLYTWEDETVARRLWPHSKKKFLYELEVDEADIRHTGDLNLYSAAKDSVAAGSSPDAAINSYCKGETAPSKPGDERPRREILVREARVVRKLESF